MPFAGAKLQEVGPSRKRPGVVGSSTMPSLAADSFSTSPQQSGHALPQLSGSHARSRALSSTASGPAAAPSLEDNANREPGTGIGASAVPSRTSSASSVVLGSKNHPEEEDSLYRLRAMMRILADEDQHNERLVHALNVLLGMSLVDDNVGKMAERGVLTAIFQMLQHKRDFQHLWAILAEHDDQLVKDDVVAVQACAKPGQDKRRDRLSLDGAIEEIYSDSLLQREEYSRRGQRPPLFPPIAHKPAKDEPFFGGLRNSRFMSRQRVTHVHTKKVLELSRPPSFASQMDDACLQGNGESDDGEGVDGMMIAPFPDHETQEQDDSSSTACSPAKSPKQKGRGMHKSRHVSNNSSAGSPSKDDIDDSVNAGRPSGTKRYQSRAKKKEVFPPPDPRQVLEYSLKIVFSISRHANTHSEIVQPSRMRFLVHVISDAPHPPPTRAVSPAVASPTQSASPTSPTSTLCQSERRSEDDENVSPENRDTPTHESKILALRLLVNISANKEMQSRFMRFPGLLSSIAKVLITDDELSDTRCAETNTSSSARDGPFAESEAEFKAISVIYNLSANVDEQAKAFRLPSSLRLRLLPQEELEKMALMHAIDIFSYKRHEIEKMLASLRKPNIREQLWEHADIIHALISKMLLGSDRLRHQVLQMFMNFSVDENLRVEMCEGEIAFLEPLVSLLKHLLDPMADVLREKKLDEDEDEDEEDVPDPQYKDKVKGFFESRFRNIFDMWVFFDRHDNWSVKVSDVEELSKQLVPEAAGVKVAEIVLIMDFKKKKVLDPHETIRALAWHEMPSEVKWKKFGKMRPTQGRQLENTKLADMLLQRTEFKTIELKDYGVNDLQHDDFIKVGDVYFKHIPEDSRIVRITHSLEKARMRKSKTLHELRLKMKQISEVYAKEKKAFQDAERRKRIAGRQAGAKNLSQGLKSAEGQPKDDVVAASVPAEEADIHAVTEGAQKSSDCYHGESAGEELDGEHDVESDDEGQLLLDHARSREWKEEQKRIKHERAQKKRIQRELADAYLSISPGAIQSMEMVLSVILNLCKDEETHERLLTEVHVVQVMKPLLMMNDESFLLGVGTTCRARVIASSILDELGEEFDFGEVPAFDEDSLRKLKAVAKRWINGILSGALNSWIYAVELCHRAPFPSPRVSGLSWKPIGEVKPWGRCLTNSALAKALMSQTEFTQEEFDKFDIRNLRCDDFIRVGEANFTAASNVSKRPVHTIPILECYRRNASQLALPAAAGVAFKALERFLEDSHGDGIWLAKIGVNSQCLLALSRALCGRDVHGARLNMLNIEVDVC